MFTVGYSRDGGKLSQFKWGMFSHSKFLQSRELEENKMAKLINKLLYFFLLITKHVTYCPKSLDLAFMKNTCPSLFCLDYTVLTLV